MKKSKLVARGCSALMLLACFGITGCAMPAFTKTMKAPRKAPDHFSCGENCPKSAKHVEAH